MKTEYGVQMFRFGKWAQGRTRAGAITPYDSLESAQARMEDAKKDWATYKSNLLGSPDEDCFPSNWRIVKRQISEWEPV